MKKGATNERPRKTQARSTAKKKSARPPTIGITRGIAISGFDAIRVNVADAERSVNDLLQEAALAALDVSTSRALGHLARAHRERTRPLAHALRALWISRELGDVEADTFLHQVELRAHKYCSRVRRKIVAGMKSEAPHDVKAAALRLFDSPVWALLPPPLAGMDEQEHAAGLIRWAGIVRKFARPTGPTTADAMTTAGMLHSGVVMALPTYAPPEDFRPEECPDRCETCKKIAKNVAATNKRDFDPDDLARAALRAFVSPEKARDLVKAGREFTERAQSSRRE